MQTISNTIVDVNGDPVVGRNVKVELVWDKTAAAFVDDGNDHALGPVLVRSKTDSDGVWSVSLSANDTLNPSDNAYKVTEGDGGAVNPNTQFSDTLVYWVQFTDGDDYWVGDILISDPGW